MNRIKFTLTTLMRSLPLHGEEGWVAPRPVMALVAVLWAWWASAPRLRKRLTTAPQLATPSRSTTIALTSDETRLVVVNREANSVSIIQSERREWQ